jgi:CBS domain-containing protein
MQFKREFNIRRMEMHAQKDESDLSPMFKLRGAENIDVRTMLQDRKPADSVANLHINIQDSVGDALRQMAENRTRALLVLDGQRICGILTGRDYVRRVLARGKVSTQLKCGDIMTERVKCVALLSSLDECIQLMAKQDLHHLPVLNVIDIQDSQGRYFKQDIMTILTVKDLIRAILSVYCSTSFRKDEPFKKITMGTILHEKGYDFVMARQEDTLEHAAQVFNEHKIGSLLISEGSKIVTGIVTETDFVRKAKSFEKDGLGKHSLREIMTPNPICISPDFTFDQALLTLLERDFHHLPFIDFIGQSYDQDNRCLGLVSITDILRILSRDAPMLREKYGKSESAHPRTS